MNLCAESWFCRVREVDSRATRCRSPQRSVSRFSTTAYLEMHSLFSSPYHSIHAYPWVAHTIIRFFGSFWNSAALKYLDFGEVKLERFLTSAVDVRLWGKRGKIHWFAAKLQVRVKEICGSLRVVVKDWLGSFCIWRFVGSQPLLKLCASISF